MLWPTSVFFDQRLPLTPSLIEALTLNLEMGCAVASSPIQLLRAGERSTHIGIVCWSYSRDSSSRGL